MNKEYTQIGNYVHIRDDEGHLRKIDAKKDIEKYLVEENNLEMLVKMINEEKENYFKLIIQNGSGYVRLDTVKKSCRRWNKFSKCLFFRYVSIIKYITTSLFDSCISLCWY